MANSGSQSAGGPSDYVAKGALAVGRDADIGLARRDPYRYRADESGNNFVSWNPYDGIGLPLRVQASFLRGAGVAAEAKVTGAPGQRRFITPPVAAQ